MDSMATFRPLHLSGMIGEQAAVQREWSEHWVALKSVEAELRTKEEIIPVEEEKLRALQERLCTGHMFAAICQPHDVSVLFYECVDVSSLAFGVQCISILMKDCNGTSGSCDGCVQGAT